MATEHERRRLDAIAKLLNNNQYSDLEIKCDERTFYVHKAIVCPAAPFLSAAMKHEFKENKANTITHEEFDADTVELALTYIYVQDYGIDDDNMNATSSSQHSKDPASPSKAYVNRRLIAHARVFGLADYWGMPDLMTLAAEKFTSNGRNGPVNYENFVNVIKEVHLRSGSNTNALAEALRVVRRTHCRKLASDDLFLKTLVGCDEAQDFAVEMIQEMNNPARNQKIVAKVEGMRLMVCDSCGDNVREVVVDDEVREGSEQKFAIKCNRCKHVFFRP